MQGLKLVYEGGATVSFESLVSTKKINNIKRSVSANSQFARRLSLVSKKCTYSPFLTGGYSHISKLHANS